MHPPTPDDNPSDQLNKAASPFRFYHRRQRQGNKTVTFNEAPEYRLFDDEDSYVTLLWQPELLDLNPDPFPLPDIVLEEESLNQAQACEGDDCMQVFDMDTNHWSLWPWQDVQRQTFKWAQEAHQPTRTSQSGWIPPDHVHDLHQAIMDCPWFAHLSWHIPVPSDDYYLVSFKYLMCLALCHYCPCASNREDHHLHGRLLPTARYHCCTSDSSMVQCYPCPDERGYPTLLGTFGSAM